MLITEHRFSPHHDHSRTSGIYNVQFMTFRNDARGLAALRWWRAACLESCELNPEEGKCGDQKYLDDWSSILSRRMALALRARKFARDVVSL